MILFSKELTMKRIIAIILSVLTVFSIMIPSTYAEEKIFDFSSSGIDFSKGIDVADLWIRDPFIVLYENVYFMYGTVGRFNGYGCYVSYDLETWYGPTCVFNADTAENFDGVGDYWAAECHYYDGDFYLFATYKSGETGYRGTSVFKSESPLGPFTEISDGHVTPHTRDCIDGTLYIEGGVPYMVYVEKFTSEADKIGGMAYVQLSDDLSHTVSESVTIFKANEPIWVDKYNRVTDGPFLYKTSNGKLIMLWSTNFEGYKTATAFSLNGKLNGEWHQSSRPIYKNDKNNAQDGGHGMIFTDKDGRMMMVIHSPNSGDTRIKLIELEDKGNYIARKDASFWDSVANRVDICFWTVADFFVNLFNKIFADC